MSELYESAIEFVQAGLRVFPLHRIKQGACTCGHAGCPAAGKHPARPDWVHQPLVDEAVLDTWLDGEMMEPYMGLGWALDAGHIVIDIDPRNGGDISFEKLQAHIGIDLIDACSAVVKTGGGGLHLYFAKPDADLAWRMPKDYPGVDIKQGGGFVVIPGSVHLSGSAYAWHSFAKSDVSELVMLPEPLAKLIARAKIERQDGDHSDVEIADIEHMLSYLDPDMPHDEWVKVGMAVHRGTDGSNAGFAAWDAWSAKGTTYKAKQMATRWHSFGKRVSSGVTIATLVGMAQQRGWVQRDHMDADLTAEEIAWIENCDSWGKKQASTKAAPRPKVTELDDIDLMRPPGHLAALLQYVRDKSLFDNRQLALATALSVASNVVGRGYQMPGRWAGVTPNLILLVIAASATGKESAMATARELLTFAGLGRACHGRIKSDKDLLDTFAHNQYANFLIDEFGVFMGRLHNAKRTGSASYLEGVIGTIMEVYTKASGVLMVDLSRRESILSSIGQAITRAMNAAEDKGGNGTAEGRRHLEEADYLKKLHGTINDNGGLVNPWLGMLTTATPSTMQDAFTREQVESGFLSRAMVFFEHESNPMPKRDYMPPASIPTAIEMRLVDSPFLQTDETAGRIDDHLPRQLLDVTPEAEDFLSRMQVFLFEWAEALKDKGMTPLARRATELIVKISIAIAGWNRSAVTLEIVRYASRLVMDDMQVKIRKAEISDKAESGEFDDRKRALILRILDVCQVWATTGEIQHRCRSRKEGSRKDDISAALKVMVRDGLLEEDAGQASGKAGRPPATRYRCTDSGIDYMAAND